MSYSWPAECSWLTGNAAGDYLFSPVAIEGDEPVESADHRGQERLVTVASHRLALGQWPHNNDSAIAGHPDYLAVDAALYLPAAAMLLQEGVERAEGLGYVVQDSGLSEQLG